MSRFMSRRHDALETYTPGEQPKNFTYIKLNTNESPFPPSEGVSEAVEKESRNLQLYSDPECRELHEKAAEFFGVKPEQVLMTNGSDEILNFAFMAFGDEANGFAFPDITYGFYPVFAKLHRIPFEEVPLKEDFSIDVREYEHIGKNIVIANPNAPTGLCLSLEEIERIVSTNLDHVAVIDEAYVDFGGKSCLPLIQKYDNLLITRTFSKSYSLAGARLGFGIGNEALIADLNTIKYSTNPYNVNRMTMAAGVAALEDWKYYKENCDTIIENRIYTKNKLEEMGFSVTDSKANFLFVSHPALKNEILYQKLKEKGILIRHFSLARIADYNRITIGTRAQMDALIEAVEAILTKSA